MESEQSQSDPNGKPTFRDRRYPWIIWAERAQQTILLTLYAVLNPNPLLPPSLQGSQHRAAALGTATRFGCCHLLRHQEQGTRVGQSPPSMPIAVPRLWGLLCPSPTPCSSSCALQELQESKPCQPALPACPWLRFSHLNSSSHI